MLGVVENYKAILIYIVVYDVWNIRCFIATVCLYIL